MYKFICATSVIICFGGCVLQKDNIPAREVAPAISKNISGPSIEIAEKEISLGSISPQQTEIKGIIPIFNLGTEILEIKKVSGPCVCFKGYSGDRIIQPEQGGEIEVRFNPAQIPAGKVKRLVKIETNDPNQPLSEVYFAFDIQRSPQEEQNRIFYTELAQLHSETEFLRREVEQLKKQLQSSKAEAEDTKIYKIPAGNSPVLGSKDAPITIVEFFDFQCPFCVKEYSTLKRVLSEYPGKVRVIFKHFPLDFHKQAPAVHAMTELVLRQKGNDAFWKLHDMIIAEPKKLEPAVLKGYAQILELDTAELEKLWSDTKATAGLLKADKELAAKCDVRGTPTIFINGKKLTDRSLGNYRNQINKILASKKKNASQVKKQVSGK